MFLNTLKCVSLSLLFLSSNLSFGTTNLIVYKDPNCGCCGKWVSYLNQQGLQATAENTNKIAQIKALYGIPGSSRSCHTAVTSNNKYVFEGHVPATSIQKMLQAPPKGALGLAVAGMPIGSPGMEIGDQIETYDVLLIMSDGSTQVFETINRL